MNINQTDHDISLNLVVTITWEEDNSHCCADDQYELRRPVKASYGDNGLEQYEYNFGMEPDNLIEEAIVKSVESGEIE